jgi:glycosyltransferase involved in cell wall biosynthesis
MIGKIDLVMWTKNGEKTLPIVLKQIDKVIPHENVCHKILIDDHSVDKTVEIAKSFGWNVNPKP